MGRNRNSLMWEAHLPIRVRLFKLQRGLCWWCERPMVDDNPDHPLYATVDHIIGLGKGGRNHQFNKLLAHRLCNAARGSVPAQHIDAPKGTTLRVFQQQQIERLQKISENRACLAPE